MLQFVKISTILISNIDVQFSLTYVSTYARLCAIGIIRPSMYPAEISKYPVALIIIITIISMSAVEKQLSSIADRFSNPMI